MNPVITNRQIQCASPREAIWNVLADTHHLNQAIGNNPLESVPIEGQGERYRVKTRLAGLSLEYEEQPFEWKYPDSISIERTFLNGPSHRYKIEWLLADNDHGGTTVGQCLVIEPRSVWGWPIVFFISQLITHRLVREIGRADTHLIQGLPPFQLAEKSAVNALALASAYQTLQKILDPQTAPLAHRLQQWIATGADEEVIRLRPFELADAWGVERRALVTVCLQAVLAGMLELSWEIICPSCRTQAARIESLSQLGELVHCHLCDITIQVDFDRAVEATFRPAESIRPLQERPYCIGGPFRTPHVVGQALLRAGSTATLPMPLQEGRYRLFIRGGVTASIEVASTGVKQGAVVAGERLVPAELTLLPQAKLVVHDQLQQDRHVKLEHLAWASAATTAHYVSTFDSFRRLFSAEVLRPGLRVKTSRVVLLFTDLTGSTALYTEFGDAKAYAFVLEHFAVLETTIEAHGGAVVKTLGDAVMAAFTDERAAVKGAIAMQRAYANFAKQRPESAGVRLCMGLFAGAAYLVNANHILDYFGQTVNIANRLQGASEGGEIVLPVEMAECLLTTGGLEGAQVVDTFDAVLKGLDQSLRAVRLVVDID